MWVAENNEARRRIGWCRFQKRAKGRIRLIFELKFWTGRARSQANDYQRANRYLKYSECCLHLLSPLLSCFIQPLRHSSVVNILAHAKILAQYYRVLIASRLKVI